jgi:hypothetical protein
MNTAFASSLIKYFELMAGVTGVICYYRKPNTIWFGFALFLICLYCMEQLGSWFIYKEMYAKNTNLYKWIVIPTLFTMYHAVYFSISSIRIRYFVLTSSILFLLFALFENIYWSTDHFYSISLTLSFGCLAVLLLSMSYFFQLLKSDQILYFKHSMPFWFCLGLLIFYLGGFPYLTFFNSMSIAKNQDIVKTYRWIFISLNWIMYFVFTIGFIWSKPKH